MSPKNPVSNFISAGDEMLAFLSNLDPKWRINDDWSEFIERNFTFVGSKPVLQNLKDYKTADYKNFADIKNFLNSNPNIQIKILSGEVSYTGDNLSGTGVKFAPELFLRFLKFTVENIPEHRYFCAPEAGWILLVAMEGYVEFGVLD